MEYTMLGSTRIPRIAVGTWSWGTGLLGGNQIFGSHLGETDLKPVFDRAVSRGFTLWDTAPVYGMGASEDLLGRLVHRPGEILLSTKFMPVGLQSRRAMERSLAKSLARLHTDHADLFWVHAPKNVEKWTAELIPLMAEGKFRYAGVSNHNLRQIQQADGILRRAGFQLAAVQNHYSLLYREPEEAGILDWCRSRGVVFFAYMVLEQGALTGRYSQTQPMPKHTRRGRAYPPMVLARLDGLRQALERIGGDAAQTAIAWAIAKGTVPIVGMTKPHQVTDEEQALAIHLTKAEIALLEQAADQARVKIRGFWEKPVST